MGRYRLEPRPTNQGPIPSATALLTVLTVVEGVVPGAGFILGLLVSAVVSAGVQDAISHSPLDAASLGESRDIGDAATVIRDAICSVDQASYQAACGNSTILMTLFEGNQHDACRPGVVPSGVSAPQ